MSDTLQEIQVEKPDQEKDYIKSTSYNQIDQAAEPRTEYGTIKLNVDYARQAITAIKGRVNALKPYTDERVAKINDNYEWYEQEKVIAEATHKVHIPMIFNLCEDWIDDLFNTFSEFADTIEIEARDNLLDRNLVRAFSVEEAEDSPGNDKIRSIQKIVTDLHSVEAKERGIYYFKNLEAIKGFVKDNLDKANYRGKLMDFLQKGVISGMFMLKGSFDANDTATLRKFDQEIDKGDIKFGEFVEEYDKEKFYNFSVVDTRRIHHRKDCLDIIIEEIDTNYWGLLNSTLDANGKPLDNAAYSYDMLKKVKEAIFENDMDNTAKLFDTEDEDLMFYADEINDSEIRRLDGDVKLMEGHGIPFRYKAQDLIKRNGGKKYEGMDGNNEITLKSKVTCLVYGNQYVPIAVQPEPQSPYRHAVMFTKKDDVSGRGLPELLSRMADLINTNMNLYLDLLDMGLKGVSAIDTDAFQNPDQLNRLRAGDVIKMKKAEGRTIDQVIQWFRPPLEQIAPMITIMETLEKYIRETSRGGAGREKISPNPTATEFASIVQELEKSVNRTGLRLNELFKWYITDSYTVTLQSRESNMELKLTGYRMKDPTYPDKLEQIEVTKWVEVRPEDLFVDGIAFKVKAMENVQKQAVENKQAIDFLKLIKEGGFDINPQTGEPAIYNDDTGQPMIIDMTKQLRNVAKGLGQEDPFKKYEPQQEPSPATTPASAGSPGGGLPAQLPGTTTSTPPVGNLTGGAVNTGGL